MRTRIHHPARYSEGNPLIMTTQQTVRTVSTVDTAKQIRAGLAAAWPGVKFSVRRGRGTAAAWISVLWDDGPRMQDVRRFAGRYQGAQFNGMTDSYDQLPHQLVATETGELPETIRYACDGITEHRHYSTAATAAAAARIIAQNPRLIPDDLRGRLAAAIDPDNETRTVRQINDALMLVPLEADQNVRYLHHRLHTSYGDLGTIVNQALHLTDFTITYDADDRCTECGAHLADPHDPHCSRHELY